MYIYIYNIYIHYIVKKTDNVPSWLLLFYQSLDVNSCTLGHMIYGLCQNVIDESMSYHEAISETVITKKAHCSLI